MRRAIMRKISCLVSVLVVLGLCACGNKEDSMTPVTETNSIETTENNEDRKEEIAIMLIIFYPS